MTAARTTGRTATLLILSLIAVMVTTVGAGPAGAQAYDGGAEAQFVASINQLRASKGLNALTVDSQLVASSRIWADQMKAAGSISHAADLSVGVTQEWQKLGENVGVGPTVTALMDAFIDSPGHYANLVDPVYTRVGIGVVWDGNVMYTTHRFMSVTAAPAPPATSPPATQPPPVLPAAPTPPAAPTTTAAPTTAPPTPVPTATSMASSSSVNAMLAALTAAGG